MSLNEPSRFKNSCFVSASIVASLRNPYPGGVGVRSVAPLIPGRKGLVFQAGRAARNRLGVDGVPLSE